MLQEAVALYAALQVPADTVTIVLTPMSVLDWAQTVGLLVVVIQLIFVIRGQVIDHDRRRKQATIEFVGGVQRLIQEPEDDLDVILGDELLIPSEAKKLFDAQGKEFAMLRAYLNKIEHVATGANANVFDQHLLYRLAGNFLTRRWQRYKNWIELVQAKHGKKRYCEFQELVELFERWQRAEKGRVRSAKQSGVARIFSWGKKN